MLIPTKVSEKELWANGRELLYFIGVNGAGKSTLAKRLADRCIKHGGIVIIDSENRAYNKEFDCANTGSTDQSVHRQVIDGAIALIEEWKRSDANLVIVDRWYESYDIELSLSSLEEIEAALKSSGFRVRVVHLIVGGSFSGADDFASMSARMAHTKANRPAAWWDTGRRLRSAFGEELLQTVHFEEASREIAGDSKTICPPDSEHISKSLQQYQPKIVLTFGKIASEAVAPHFNGRIIQVPHPAARQPGTVDKLRAAASEYADFVKSLGEGARS